MDEYYNKHYIRIDEYNNIIKGFSDAFEQPRDGDICINGQGGYQFRLFPDGAENPQLYDENGICLYRYADGVITAKTTDELQAELNILPAPDAPLSEMDYIRLALAELAEMMTGGNV